MTVTLFKAPTSIYVTGPMKRALNAGVMKINLSLTELFLSYNLIYNALSYHKHTLRFFASM